MGLFNKLFKRPPSKPDEHSKEPPVDLLQTSLQENIQNIKRRMGNSSDIVIREIQIGTVKQFKAGIFYTDGLTDIPSVQNFILESLMLDSKNVELDQQLSSHPNVLQVLKERILAVGDIQDITNLDSLLTSLLSGDVIFLLDGYAQGFNIGMRGWKDRGVQEPKKEVVVRGPHESFSESLRTNTALIRRIIKDDHLWLESRVIGTITKTDVAIMYLKNIVDDKTVEEVRRRLDRIDIDGILDSSYIEELIQDDTFTPFPTVLNTERPDVVAAELLEGKVAILVDGSPHALSVPALFVAFFHSPEDYYQRADISTLIRMIRYLGIAISFMGPSLYIAITTFHQEMLPTPLLINIAAQREGVPFPAYVEAFMMELMFEILREAGLRMPKSVGQAVSIVGTLVLGTAAVDAGIVSAAMVIVVAATAISSFVFPANNMSIAFRMLRFPLMVLAASFGLFGIMVGIFALVLHLCSLRSFGVPYMAPFAPLILEDQKDTILRVPLWAMITRPRITNQKNPIRERIDPPTPPKRKQTED